MDNDEARMTGWPRVRGGATAFTDEPAESDARTPDEPAAGRGVQRPDAPLDRVQAVAQAYDDHLADVYRLAYAILRESEAATDATQEAFARAFERWHTYDAGRPLRPWLLAIVARIALDVVRRRRVRSVAVARLESRAEATADDPGSLLARRELVEACLARVSPQARGALVLRHFYGYSYDEIGRLLGTSSGNVGSVLSRAHALLRAELATDGGVDGPAPRGREANGERGSTAASQENRGLG